MSKARPAAVAIVLVGVATFSAWMFFSREGNEPAAPLSEAVDQPGPSAELPAATPAHASESLPPPDADSQGVPESDAFVAFRDRFIANQIIVEGSVSPEGLPYGVRVGLAFDRLAAQQQSIGNVRFAETLKNRYDASDSEVDRITDYAARNPAFQEEVQRESVDGMTALCSEVVEVGVTGMGLHQIAARLTAIEDRRLARLEAHYKEAVAGLDPITRQYLTTESAMLARGTTYGRTNYVGLAYDLPEFAAQRWESSCQKWIQQYAGADAAQSERVSPLGQ